jgi:hypothetical protein
MSDDTPLDKLGNILIELEYACAEFLAWESAETERPQVPDLEPLFSRLLKTSHAIQTIIGVLAERRPDGAANRKS